jgi:hypothetical protein
MDELVFCLPEKKDICVCTFVFSYHFATWDLPN